MISIAQHHYDSLKTPDDIRKYATEVSEGQHLDYKRHESGDTRVWHDSITKAVCAFANADGGVLVIGVTDDRKCIPFPVGPAAEESIKRQISSRLSAYPDLRMKSIRDTGTTGYLVILIVPAMSPCAFEPKQKRMSEKALWFPRRRGEESLPMNAGELADMFGRRLRPKFALAGAVSYENTSYKFSLNLVNVGGASADRPSIHIDEQKSGGIEELIVPPSSWSLSDGFLQPHADLLIHPGQSKNLVAWVLDLSVITWEPPWTFSCKVYSRDTPPASCKLTITPEYKDELWALSQGVDPSQAWPLRIPDHLFEPKFR